MSKRHGEKVEGGSRPEPAYVGQEDEVDRTAHYQLGCGDRVKGQDAALIVKGLARRRLRLQRLLILKRDVDHILEASDGGKQGPRSVTATLAEHAGHRLRAHRRLLERLKATSSTYPLRACDALREEQRARRPGDCLDDHGVALAAHLAHAVEVWVARRHDGVQPDCERRVVLGQRQPATGEVAAPPRVHEGLAVPLAYEAPERRKNTNSGLQRRREAGREEKQVRRKTSVRVRQNCFISNCIARSRSVEEPQSGSARPRMACALA